MLPRLSTPAQEGVLRVSKWLKFQVLLDEEEMAELLQVLDPLKIFIVSQLVTKENCEISPADFLEKYTTYAAALKQGQLPDEATLRPVFSSLFTATSDILYAQEVRADTFLIKAIKPVIQLQAHHFFVSAIDGKFHPMVLSEESVTWGLQFSYPQLAQDPKTSAFAKVVDSPDFPNTAPFLRLAKWLRRKSSPTPFWYRGVKTYVPMRLGKKCFGWIAHHPQLKGLEVS